MEPTRISTPQETQATHSSRSKTAAHTGKAQGSATEQSPGAFLSLLATLGGLEADGGEDLLEINSTDPAQQGNAAMAAWQSLVAPQGDAMHMGYVASADIPGAMFGGRISNEAGASLVGQTAALDNAADLKESGLTKPATGRGHAFSKAQTMNAQRSDGAAVGGPSLVQHSAKVADSASLIAPHLAQSATGQSSDAKEARSSPVLALQRNATDSMGASIAGLSGSQGLAGAAFSASNATVQKRAGSDVVAENPCTEGASFDIHEPGSTDAPAGMLDPSNGAEEWVADHVAYWISQKTQNAELTLNRDGQPVEVSVSLSGNEAHVTFRSNEAQTREWLDRSAAQLDDLLRGEGLQLAGMTVGSGEASNSQAGEQARQRHREGMRQAQILTPMSNVPTIHRGTSTVQRAVDIFV